MKLRFYLLTVFLSLQINATFANYNPADTSARPWHLSKPEFLKRYGDDDTSRALIRYWYNERNVLSYLTTASVLTVAGGGIGILATQNSSTLPDIASLAYVLLMGIGTIAFIPFFTGLLFRSRKKLWRLIDKYKKGEGLPKGVKRRLHIRHGK